MSHEFLVRRPLRRKQGTLLDIKKDGQHFSVTLDLSWPNLLITTNGGSAEEFPIAHCTTKASPSDDTTHQGKRIFCIEVHDNKKRETRKWFADTEAERKDWCFLLRKHSVHHNLSNGFKVSSQVLGTGAFSTVLLAKDVITFESVALKMIKKSRLNEEERLLLVDEIRIAQVIFVAPFPVQDHLHCLANDSVNEQAVSHKYCVSTREFIETEDTYVLVMEYVGGGELFMKIARNIYSEADVRRIMIQLMRGVAYLHSRGICHRDLKPENFLLTSDAQPVVKIGDYGIAADVDPSNKNYCLKDKDRLRCSPGYGAPEIVLLKPYGLPVDMYSLGVCLYLLLTGIQPFQGRDEVDTRDKMVKATYDPGPLQACDPLASDLVARLLDKNADTRITAHAALQHPFLKDSFTPSNNQSEGNKDNQAGCCCFGYKGLVSGQAFKDPSQHSAMYTGAIIPSTVDSSVRMGPKAFQNGFGGGSELMRSDHTHMLAR